MDHTEDKINLSEDKMNFTEDNCNVVLGLFDNGDEMNGMAMLYNLLTSYHEKYKIIPDVYETTFDIEFRNDTTLIFEVFYKSLTNDKVVKEMDDDFDENDEADQKDKTEFMNFVDNVAFVLQKIATVDLQKPNVEFSTNCGNAIAYLIQKQKDMIKLTNTMQKLSHTLELAAAAFTPVPRLEILATKPSQ
jgi:hypothetical protein